MSDDLMVTNANMDDEKTAESSKRMSSEMPSKSTSESGSENSEGEGEKNINVLQNQLMKVNDEISVLATMSIKHKRKTYRKNPISIDRRKKLSAVEMKHSKMPDAPMVTDLNMKDEKNEESSKSMSSRMSSKSSSKCVSKVCEKEREKRLNALQDQLKEITKELKELAAKNKYTKTRDKKDLHSPPQSAPTLV